MGGQNMISEAVSIDVGSLGAVGAKAATAGATPRTLVSSRVVAREAAAAALLSPRDLGASVAPHPGWVAVMLLSARYGSRGFGLAFLAVSGALTMSALALDIGLGPLATLASNSAPDLGALVACVLIAWISSGHERRIGDMTARAAELEKKNGDDRAVIAELRDAAVTLRARADRMDHSLTFVRDVARRLEGDDALEGLQEALELALARTGARAGVVQLVEQDRLR